LFVFSSYYWKDENWSNWLFFFSSKKMFIRFLVINMQQTMNNGLPPTIHIWFDMRISINLSLYQTKMDYCTNSNQETFKSYDNNRFFYNRYDARFFNYYWGKVAQVWELWKSAHRFYVFPNGFVVCSSNFHPKWRLEPFHSVRSIPLFEKKNMELVNSNNSCFVDIDISILVFFFFI
jgi:hypothetical protein